MRKLLLLISTLFLLTPVFAFQSDTLSANNVAIASDSFYIKDVLIECHEKTIDRIILRELAFKKGSKIAKIKVDSLLQREANKIFNTGLFVLAEVFPIMEKGDTINLLVSVVEKWYLYPVPIFEIADRNFNEWWQQRNRDFSRVNFGIRFTKENFRGRNETLKVLLQFGFVERYGFEYKLPYIDKAQTTGLVFKIDYVQNRNLAYKTENNKLAFLKSENVMRERFWTSLGFFKRNAFYDTHYLTAGFDKQAVRDTLLELNSDYLVGGQNKQQYFYINYAYGHDSRDMATYPTKGSLLNFSVAQKGLGSFDDLFQFEVKVLAAKFFQLSKPTAKKPFFYSTTVRAFVSFPRRRPYTELRGFGYNGDFIRGYELYVIDGQHFGISKNTLRWRLLSTQKNLSRFMPLKQFSTLPIAAYLKTYLDVGYVKNNFVGDTNKRLTNTLLWGNGVGLDLLFYNSLLFRFEYSHNRQGDTGFFFGFEADF